MLSPSGNLSCLRSRHWAAIILLFLLHGAAVAQPDDARAIINKVMEKLGGINTACYQLTYCEKVFETGKMRRGSSDIKYRKTTQRVYMKTENGTELLWGPDLNDGDVLVHPSSFPFFNLSLNPDGYWMRKDQHHGVQDIGFQYLSVVLNAAIKRAGDRFSDYFTYAGDTTLCGTNCLKIKVAAPRFGYIKYKVGKGENIITIARNLALNEYLVLKHNPGTGSYTDVKEGQTILISTDYAPLVELCIDKHTLIPLMLQVNDEKGLFEQYIYRNLVINPAMDESEFSKDYKDYHF
ncbi:MAG: DUF1571 domain-containing protein [Bacteroidia bacterium]|nr:DUF1571 domain-containing protein [Bacteroidia bacterium]